MCLRKKTTRFKEIYCSIVAYFPVLIAGMQAGFPAFIIPQLRQEMKLDTDQLSWLASLGYFALILGPITSLIFIDRFGRKTNLKLVLSLFTIGWIIILISKNFPNLLIGSMFCGIAAGASAPLAIVYVSEISRTKYRGSLLSLVWLTSIIGTSAVYTLEYYLPWRRAVIVIIILALFGILQLRVIPESKFWYLMQDRKDDAKRSAAWFENTQVVMKEIDIIYAFIQVGKVYMDEGTVKMAKLTCSGIKNLQIWPFLLAVIVSVLRCGTGKILFTVYPVNMFTDMGTPFNSMVMGVWYGFLNFLCCLANIVIFTTVDRFNRKNFFYALSTVMILALTSIICIEWLSTGPVKALPSLRVFCMYVYLIIESTGYFCITSIMVTEVIPLMQRGVALSLNYLIVNIVYAIYIKVFPLIEHSVTFRSLCVFFLINVALIVIVVTKFYPDSRGRMYFGVESAVYDSLQTNNFDKMMNEDWFRNEDVQRFFTENEYFNIEKLDAEKLRNLNREWLDKMKQMMNQPVNESIAMVPEKQHLLTVNEITGNPFDFEKMAKNRQVWMENMKTSWNSWTANNYMSASTGAFKQQQLWLKNMWTGNYNMPKQPKRSQRSQRQESSRKMAVAEKSNVAGGDEKLV